LPLAAVLFRTTLPGLLACLLLATAAGGQARAADDATSAARSHYEVGLKLFDAREHDQALLEFRAANELKPRPAALFMMAQCEYLLGRLKAARAHYQTYASENPVGEFVELAKDRIESIDKRPSTFVINTVPEDVDVRIVSETAPNQPPVTGQAPNNFSVPRGRYRITVAKANFLQQSRVVEIDLADTRPLFFKLEPIPARLEVETNPPGATLYVNGNRARNPYRQDVVPGHYELFAEAPDWRGRSVEFTLNPGERLLMTDARRMQLQYIQRSGRPELMVATALLFSFGGAAAVAAAIGRPLEDANVSAVLLTSGGGLTGAAIGALAANALVPPYIADNRALFIISAMWIGAAEGAGVGIAWEQAATNNEAPDPRCPGCRPSLGERLRAGFLGSLPGLALGITGGALMSKHAPTYGRVSLIQSAALGGVVAGGLLAVAMQWKPYGKDWEHQLRTLPTPPMNTPCQPSDKFSSDGKEQVDCIVGERSLLDLTLPALIGLNVGLGAGLLGAYLPDQSHYGLTWRRVLLIDLATAAGVVGGGIAGCVAVDNCLNATPTDGSRAKAAIAALIGGGVGAVAGVLLTRNLEDTSDRASAPPPATVTVLPAASPRGGVVPMLSAFGAF
jgi:surface antigen